MKNIIFFTIALLFISEISAQKIEKEMRVNSEVIPKIALEFMYNATQSSKIKWYYERNEFGSFYKARFKLKKQNAGAKFDLEGNLQNVEIEISKSKIPTKVKRSLRKYFKLYFTRYKILKVEKQYRVDSDKLVEQIKNFSILKSAPTFYKIAAIGKKTDNLVSTEFLMDSTGFLVSSKKIIDNPNDNLNN